MTEINHKQHFPGTSLKTLIHELQHLLHGVSQRLRQLHLSRHEKQAPQSAVDIWGRLGNFIETHPVDEETESHIEQHLNELGNARKHATAGKHKHSLENYLDGRPRERGQLGDYYQRQRVRVEVKPDMSLKMYRNAMDHINSSLHFVKKGDVEGARLHIELAESATHVASQFMSKQEFKDFEQKILDRIKDILDEGHPGQKPETL